MVKIHYSLVVWLAFAYFAISARQKKRKPTAAPPTNNIFFEKFEYEIYNKTLIQMHYVDIRPIARNVIKGNASGTVTDTLDEIWLEGRLYYKYTTYQQTLGTVHLEVCSFFNKTMQNPVAEIIYANIKEALAVNGAYLSFKLHCPYLGHMYGWHPGINISYLSFPLMPAGRYRVDIKQKRTRHGSPFALQQYYMRISDLRVWF